MDRTLTLTQIEGQDWGEPSFSSFLVTECHRLRHVPLAQLTPENLRILIRQAISLPVLVPMALEVLEAEPLIECDHYAGDLLEAVRECPEAFWATHPALKAKLGSVVEAANQLGGTE